MEHSQKDNRITKRIQDLIRRFRKAKGPIKRFEDLMKRAGIKKLLFIYIVLTLSGCGYAIYDRQGVRDYCDICKAEGRIQVFQDTNKAWKIQEDTK